MSLSSAVNSIMSLQMVGKGLEVLGSSNCAKMACKIVAEANPSDGDLGIAEREDLISGGNQKIGS